MVAQETLTEKQTQVISSWKLLVTVVDPKFCSDLPFAVPTVDTYAHISRGTPERS